MARQNTSAYELFRQKNNFKRIFFINSGLCCGFQPPEFFFGCFLKNFNLIFGWGIRCWAGV